MPILEGILSFAVLGAAVGGIIFGAPPRRRWVTAIAGAVVGALMYLALAAPDLLLGPIP